MNVLLCGHTSFLAQGLLDQLRRAGHTVTCFGRGPVAAPAPDSITGPVDQIHDNPHLRDSRFDTVINYILLKEEGVDRNVAYVDSLARFCKDRGVRHLIHVSSISSYKSSVRVVNETAPIETDPSKKGAYGGPKVATDLYLLDHLSPDVKLTLIRPGFVLGKGVVNPIVGTAARLPWNRLLVIGDGRSAMPITTRDLVNQAMVKLVAAPPAEAREVIAVVDSNSPTRVEFLEHCCRLFGTGRGVSSLPSWFWWSAAVGGELVARAIGQGKLQPYNKLTARLKRQRYNSDSSAARLGLNLSVDLPAALKESLSAQEPNVRPPYVPSQIPATTPARDITFLGFGRIVKQRHLPALKRLSFPGRVRAFDVRPFTADDGTQVQSLDAAAPLGRSDLTIVASPGPAHIKAIDLLRSADGPVLVEKPLCYSPDELQQWLDFAASRTSPVFVCHNYRYKANVRQMLEVLQRHNPGRLDHVSLVYQSPPVSNESAAWLRDERRARTLLMDYSIHFLDLACMFASPDRPWRVDGVRHRLNDLGQTSVIEGRLTGDYSVGFLLKQGFAPRRARLLFSFQNYALSLAFFPDTFVPYMADDNPWLHKAEAKVSRQQTFRKIVDKLTKRESDDSHAAVIGGAAQSSPSVESITVPRLADFYRTLFQIGEQCYGAVDDLSRRP